MKSDDGSKVWLSARNGGQVNKSEDVEIKRGESFVGWVFKTGLPLIIPNVKEYMSGVYLTDELLEKVSLLREINDEDRFLKFEESPHNYPWTSNLQAISFLAVPIRPKDQEVQGVLCGYRTITAKNHYPFDRTQLVLATSFSTTTALAFEHEKQRIINDLLTELGYLTNADQLFKIITEKIPKLITSSGCSIFTSILQRGVSRLKLTYSSQNGLRLDNGTFPEIYYEIGEGKTGTCGLYQTTLAVNHYGNGNASLYALDQEMERIKAEHPNDITNEVFDTLNNKVGLFHLWSYDKLQMFKSVPIREFAKSIIITPNGIPSNKLDQYIGEQWSFVATPINSEQRLLGVVSVDRPISESPFLANDISLLRSIAGRLASVMNNLQIQEQRKQLVMSLAHEINTPLTGILADSENLYQEAPANSEIQKIAKHNLGQVLRLHMQTSTIMSVLSEQNYVRQFKEHSIFRPLKEACELFESEAAQNGCDILGPRAREGGFPTIEMLLFDLTIAFKNIIHNAVKYSFRPPANLDKHRTIKVWGEWYKNKEFYLVHIQNYGVGISPTEIENRLIFAPYYRGEKASDRKRTGSGFGLAHARLVIEDLHGGFIIVTSTPQGGDAHLTTFTVRLPIRQPRPIGG
jgi:signal transduction histidine kinase